MKLIVRIKNSIEDLYQKYSVVTSFILRFALAFFVLMVLRGNIGFNEILTNIFFVIGFSVVCAFIPPKPLVLMLTAYAVIQIFSLSAGVGLFACILFVFMYLVYFRFDENSGYVVLLIPLLSMIGLPSLIPLVLAVSSSAGSVVSIAIGTIAYYFLRYIHANAAVLQGVADIIEVNKMSMVISGVFTYREMWYTTGCIILVFFATYYIKKININRSNEMALAVGSGIYLISILVCSLLFRDITSQNLLSVVIGTVISCILAMIISSIILPFDYKRTELLEFEDEEYKYYVRAVPKSTVSRESVRIKKIYSRRSSAVEKTQEEDK